MRSLLSVLAVLGLAVVGLSLPGTNTARAGASSGGTQSLLRLDHRVLARVQPAPHSRIVGAVGVRTPLTGSRTVLPVLQVVRGPAGGRWLRVQLPMRPNGVSGWVPADSGTVRQTAWRIVIHRATHSAVVLYGPRVRARFSVIVGQRSTPTPLGKFFVVEKIRVAPGATEGPWALATSAYSNVLHEFAGGPGQVALHGIVGLNAPLGTSASHGCVRFGNAAITWLANHVDNGIPITIQT